MCCGLPIRITTASESRLVQIAVLVGFYDYKSGRATASVHESVAGGARWNAIRTHATSNRMHTVRAMSGTKPLNDATTIRMMLRLESNCSAARADVGHVRGMSKTVSLVNVTRSDQYFRRVAQDIRTPFIDFRGELMTRPF